MNPSRSSSRSAESPNPSPKLVALPPGHRWPLLKAFVFAFHGLFRTLATQPNMKIHWVSGLAVMMVGMALPLDLAARAGLLFCVFLVLGMEILNTALESVVDLQIQTRSYAAMVAKDAAAAAVLVPALGAVVILADVLWLEWHIVENNLDAVWRTVALGVPALALIAHILFGARRIVRIGLEAAIAIGLVGILAWHSTDLIYSLAAMGFVICTFVCRCLEPHLRAFYPSIQSTNPPPQN